MYRATSYDVFQPSEARSGAILLSSYAWKSAQYPHAEGPNMYAHLEAYIDYKIERVLSVVRFPHTGNAALSH